MGGATLGLDDRLQSGQAETDTVGDDDGFAFTEGMVIDRYVVGFSRQSG